MTTLLLAIIAALLVLLGLTIRALLHARRLLAVATHQLAGELWRAFDAERYHGLPPLFREGITTAAEPDYDAGAIPRTSLRRVPVDPDNGGAAKGIAVEPWEKDPS